MFQNHPQASHYTREPPPSQISMAVEHLVGSQSFLHMLLRLHSSDDKFLNNQSDVVAKYLFENIIYSENDEGGKKEEQ